MPSHTPKFGIPSIGDWSNMWTVWDFVTRRMIPPAMLFEKPIDLRHICLFYLGHIPTFLDIHLSRLLDEPHTEPQEFKVSSYLKETISGSYLTCSTFSRYEATAFLNIGTAKSDCREALTPMLTTRPNATMFALLLSFIHLT
jgi:hypothetical protein